MPRSYKHISYYENDILELRKQGLSKREISEKLGLTIKQLTNFITRYNRKQDKINVGIAIKSKGRPTKNYVVTEEMKINQLKYIIARKDSRIRQLEMENELMRDFLSLTERK